MSDNQNFPISHSHRAGGLSPRERFLAAARCQPLDRPPVWIMRQAGRYLPEYRALKERHSFVEMVRTPELATEVTLQPLRRFPLDAAILFSDILVIPEALGQPYSFRETGGIAMEYALQTPAQIRALRAADAVSEHLDYVAQAMRLCRRELGGNGQKADSAHPVNQENTARTTAETHPTTPTGSAYSGRQTLPPDELTTAGSGQKPRGNERAPCCNERALLGFAGAPWTLAAYMVEGGSSADFPRLKALAYTEPKLFAELMEKLSDAVATLLNMKIAAGADAVQIFDSWAALCPGRDYFELSLRWIARVIERLPKDVPVIVFSKGMAHHANAIAAAGAQVVGLDWSADIAAVAASLPANIAVQGNLEPTLLSFAPEHVVRAKARAIVDAMRPRPGHIFNLGHGILPDARIENVAALIHEVQSHTHT